MLGAICGDILGSTYEFGIEDKEIFLMHEEDHVTDDSVLTCAIAEWMMEYGNVSALGEGEQKYMPVSLALFFGSVALIILGSNIMLKSTYLNLDVFFYFMKVAGGGAVVFGILGYFMGRIIENSKKDKINTQENKHTLKNDDLLIKDLLVYDIGIEKKEKEAEKKSADKN